METVLHFEPNSTKTVGGRNVIEMLNEARHIVRLYFYSCVLRRLNRQEGGKSESIH